MYTRALPSAINCLGQERFRLHPHSSTLSYPCLSTNQFPAYQANKIDLSIIYTYMYSPKTMFIHTYIPSTYLQKHSIFTAWAARRRWPQGSARGVAFLRHGATSPCQSPSWFRRHWAGFAAPKKAIGGTMKLEIYPWVIDGSLKCIASWMPGLLVCWFVCLLNKWYRHQFSQYCYLSLLLELPWPWK